MPTNKKYHFHVECNPTEEQLNSLGERGYSIKGVIMDPTDVHLYKVFMQKEV